MTPLEKLAATFEDSAASSSAPAELRTAVAEMPAAISAAVANGLTYDLTLRAMGVVMPPFAASIDEALTGDGDVSAYVYVLSEFAYHVQGLPLEYACAAILILPRIGVADLRDAVVALSATGVPHTYVSAAPSLGAALDAWERGMPVEYLGAL